MTEVVGEVTSLAFGGQGVLRADGLVIFVPFTVAGEQVRVRITKQHKRFAEGQLIEVLRPAPERIAAPCPYYGRCGGCQLQHMNYAEQLRRKQSFVTDALKRIGNITLDAPISITAADPIWAYRRHIHLSLSQLQGRYQAGYICLDGTTPLPIRQCPIFLSDELDFIASLEELSPVEGEAHLGVYKNGEPFILAYDFSKKFPPHLETFALRQLEQFTKIEGITAQCGNKTKSWGNVEGQFSLDGLQIVFSPLAFVQNHATQSAAIYHKVVELAGERVLDLYCGIGALTLLLAQKGAAVTGVETSAEAIRLAQLNAAQNNLKALFICDEVSKRAKELLKAPWDSVIVNPPRSGLDVQTRDLLLKARPQQILYLSCMPSTLARDLAAAYQAGYQIHSCQAYDMFPQTTHVETLVDLRLAPQGT